MKTRLYFPLLIALLALLTGRNVLAQSYTLTGFQVTSTGKNYVVTVTRPRDNTNNGYIRIYSGTTATPKTNLLTDETPGKGTSSASNDTRSSPWGEYSTGPDDHMLSGVFSTNNIAATDDKLYAVYVLDTGSEVAISNGVAITRTTAPVLTSLSKTRAWPGSSFVISGSNLGAAGDTGPITIGSINLKLESRSQNSITVRVPRYNVTLSPGTYPVQVKANNGTPTTLASNTLSFTIAPQATIVPTISVSPNVATIGDAFTITGTNIESWYAYNITSITCNGATIPVPDNPDYYTAVGADERILVVKVPGNATSGLGTVVVNTTAGSVSVPFTVKGLEQFIPCGSNGIACTNQCVPNGYSAAIIQGRVKADPGTEWDKYIKATNEAGISPFASSKEHEMVQWQVSFDNYNWSDLTGEIGPSYAPGSSWATRYVRRVSTHLVYSFFTTTRETWYTSNVVTLTPNPVAVTPTQSSYDAYPGSTFTISFQLPSGVTSTCWSLPANTWTINGGQGVNGYYCYNVGGTTTVTVSVPAGTAPGNYVIHTSSSGPCGGSSNYTIIPVVVRSGSAMAGPTSVSFVPNGTYTNPSCPRYTVRSSLVGGATSYKAVLHGSIYEGIQMTVAPNGGYYVDFPFNIGTTYGLTVSVTATVPNGTTTATTATGPNTTCRGALATTSATTTPVSLYPNPANDQVTLLGGVQESEAVFYDSRGARCKVVSLPGHTTATVVDLRGLSAGLYQVRIAAKGEAVRILRLAIQR